jgi:hypothetical protein
MPQPKSKRINRTFTLAAATLLFLRLDSRFIFLFIIKTILSQIDCCFFSIIYIIPAPLKKSSIKKILEADKRFYVFNYIIFNAFCKHLEKIRCGQNALTTKNQEQKKVIRVI